MRMLGPRTFELELPLQQPQGLGQLEMLQKHTLASNPEAPCAEAGRSPKSKPVASAKAAPVVAAAAVGTPLLGSAAEGRTEAGREREAGRGGSGWWVTVAGGRGEKSDKMRPGDRNFQEKKRRGARTSCCLYWGSCRTISGPAAGGLERKKPWQLSFPNPTTQAPRWGGVLAAPPPPQRLLALLLF